MARRVVAWTLELRKDAAPAGLRTYKVSLMVHRDAFQVKAVGNQNRRGENRLAHAH